VCSIKSGLEFARSHGRPWILYYSWLGSLPGGSLSTAYLRQYSNLHRVAIDRKIRARSDQIRQHSLSTPDGRSSEREPRRGIDGQNLPPDRGEGLISGLMVLGA